MSELVSGLPEVVADEEEVARFITSSGWVAASVGRVKHPAFLPAPDHDTSVTRCSTLLRASLWPIAREQGLDRVHGAGVVRAAAVRAAGVDVIADEPPPFHANLRGWPLHEDPEKQKEARKKAAMKIAEEARYVPKAES